MTLIRPVRPVGPTPWRSRRNWIHIYLTFMRGLSEKVKLKRKLKRKRTQRKIRKCTAKVEEEVGVKRNEERWNRICRPQKSEGSQSTAASQLWVDVMKENLCKLCHVFGLYNFLIFHSSACHTHAHILTQKDYNTVGSSEVALFCRSNTHSYTPRHSHSNVASSLWYNAQVAGCLSHSVSLFNLM